MTASFDFPSAQANYNLFVHFMLCLNLSFVYKNCLCQTVLIFPLISPNHGDAERIPPVNQVHHGCQATDTWQKARTQGQWEEVLWVCCCSSVLWKRNVNTWPQPLTSSTLMIKHCALQLIHYQILFCYCYVAMMDTGWSCRHCMAYGVWKHTLISKVSCLSQI